MPLGDVPQRVAPLHVVDGSAAGARHRGRGCSPSAASPAALPSSTTSATTGARPPARGRLAEADVGRPLRGDERPEQGDPGDQPGRAPLQAAGQGHRAGLAAPDVGDRLDEQRGDQLDPHEPADEGQRLHQELVGDVRVAQGVGDVGDRGDARRAAASPPRRSGRPARRRRAPATPTRDSRPRPTSAARFGVERSSTHRSITFAVVRLGSTSGSPRPHGPPLTGAAGVSPAPP